MQLRTPEDALDLLRKLGAPPHLVRHHQLVAEAATELVEGLGSDLSDADAQFVQLGAALHDAGKIVHPAEMHGPGHQHEPAGRALLEAAGVGALARVCVTHADWDARDVPLVDLLVALADKLWKGKRVAELERRVVEGLAASTSEAFWNVFVDADAVFERVASTADDRIARSRC